jgi:anti-anti-sigma factor
VNLAGPRLIVVGASTGGTDAIKSFLSQMPADCPAILIAQHMPEIFTKSFAQRLNASCAVEVQEACGAERVLPGHAYVAPGHSHLALVRDGSGYVTRLLPAPALNRYRPSVDVLFLSAAKSAAADAIAVLLTGMGKDGAAGMAALYRSGAITIAQDQASCVVFGMPKEAIALGAVDEVLPLGEIAKRVLWFANGGKRPKRPPRGPLSEAAATSRRQPVCSDGKPQAPSAAAVNRPLPTGAHTVMQTLVQTDGGIARILLRGRFDFGSHREFKTSYEAPLGAAGVDELHIDMGGVEYLDSSALGMLLILKERAGATNKRVAITNCRGAVRQVLDIANFSKLFQIK